MPIHPPRYCWLILSSFFKQHQRWWVIAVTAFSGLGNYLTSHMERFITEDLDSISCSFGDSLVLLLDNFSNFFFSGNKSIICHAYWTKHQSTKFYLKMYGLSVWYQAASLKVSQKMRCPEGFCLHGPLRLVGLWQSSGI